MVASTPGAFTSGATRNRSSPSGSKSFASTGTSAWLPTRRRTESGTATGGSLGAFVPDTSTVTSVFGLSPPCGSAAWYVNWWKPASVGVYRRAGRPDGPFVTVMVAVSPGSWANVLIVSGSRSGSMSLVRTSMLIGRLGLVLAWSGRAIGGWLGLSGGNNCTVTTAAAVLPTESVMV